MRRRTWASRIVCAVILSLYTDREFRAGLSQSFAGGSGELGCWTGIGGDVGPNHYVQVIKDCRSGAEYCSNDPTRSCSEDADCGAGNGCYPLTHSTVAIYKKTATCCTGPGQCGTSPCSTDGDCGPQRCNWPIQFPMDWLAENDGSFCDSQGGGTDPTVMYDQFADRWFLSEKSFGDCVYVSKSNDPTAGWPSPSAMKENWTRVRVPCVGEYPRWAVWPISTNCPNPSYCGSYVATSGNGACLLDRGKLLSGAASPPAGSSCLWCWDDCEVDDPVCQEFVIGFPFMKPADVDGPAAPEAGEPAILLFNCDNCSFNRRLDSLLIWTVDVNWTAQPPIKSFSAEPIVIGTSPFNSDMSCDPDPTSEACVSQPNDTAPKLSAFTRWPSDRLTYRNRGTHQALVGNFTVNAGFNRAAVRWFELRKGENWQGCSPGFHGLGWEKCQEGTVTSPLHGWVGSAAMNGAGNIAVGYNVSSASVYPGLRYTGRWSTATPGSMLPECNLRTGETYSIETHWNLSSAMNVDPVDDETFWFTGQYMQSPNPNNGFSTWIGAFGFDGGLCP